MTKEKAKKVSLEIWGYLRDHPKCMTKCDLPKQLLKKVENVLNECALCSLFYDTDNICTGCPLSVGDRGVLGCHEAYDKWGFSNNSERKRVQGASEMIKLIEAWEI